jgi:hypothetical protein
MAISRSDLLKELRPALQKLFEETYAEFDPKLYEIKVDFDGKAIRSTDNIGND